MRQFYLIFVFFILVSLLNSILAFPKSSKEPKKVQQMSDRTQSGTQQSIERTVDEPVYSPRNKRSCVRRGGNCENNPDVCCYNSSCRCNLWGTNCRCMRVGWSEK